MKVSACATCGHGYVIMDGQPLHGVAPIGPILRSISGLGNMSNTGSRLLHLQIPHASQIKFLGRFDLLFFYSWVAPPDVGNMLDPQACTAFPATSSIAPLEHLG